MPTDEPPRDIDGADRWLAEARVDEAVERRRRSAWLRRQAADDASLAGVLVDLAERHHAVTVDTTTGRRHTGRIGVVGADVVGLWAADGAEVLMRMDTVVSVRPGPGQPLAGGDDPGPVRATLAGRLRALAAHRSRVCLVPHGGSSITGELQSVGRDVLIVRTDGGEVAYVALASVAEASVGESG